MLFSLEIDGWKKNIRFSSAHFIPGHTKCSRLHGHTYALFLTLEAEQVTESGMIMDFSILTTCLKKLADMLDHKILIPQKYKGVKQQDSSVLVSCDTKQYQLPIEDCVLLPLDIITAEQLAQYCLNYVEETVTLPKMVTKITVGVDEGFGTRASATKQRR